MLAPARESRIGFSPRAWIDALGGEAMLPRSYAEWRPLCVGYFRFADLIEPVDAPPIDRHYISLTLGGQLEVEGVLNGTRLSAEMRRGQLLFMAAGQSNVWRWDRPTEEAHVFLDPRVIEQIAAESRCGRVEFVNRFAIEDLTIQHIVLSLVDELRSPGPAAGMLAETAAQYLALHLLRRHCYRHHEFPLPGALTTAQMRRIERHIDGQLNAEITLEQLADAVGMSQFHFARSFRKTTGQSAHRWLTLRRIERAKTLLWSSPLSILEVAQEVGFQSQSHFGQIFRRHTGRSPRAWRRLARC